MRLAVTDRPGEPVGELLTRNEIWAVTLSEVILGLANPGVNSASGTAGPTRS